METITAKPKQEKQYLFVDKHYAVAEKNLVDDTVKGIETSLYSIPTNIDRTLKQLPFLVKKTAEDARNQITKSKEDFKNKADKSTEAAVKNILQMLHRNEDINDMVIGGQQVITNKILLKALAEKQAEWLDQLEPHKKRQEEKAKKQRKKIPLSQTGQRLEWRTDLVASFLSKANDIKSHTSYRAEEIKQYEEKRSSMKDYIKTENLSGANKTLLGIELHKFNTTLNTAQSTLKQLQLAQANNHNEKELQKLIDTSITTAALRLSEWDKIAKNITSPTPPKPTAKEDEEENTQASLIKTIDATKATFNKLELPTDMKFFGNGLPINDAVTKNANYITYLELFRKTQTLIKYVKGLTNASNPSLLEIGETMRTDFDSKLEEADKNIKKLTNDRKEFIPVVEKKESKTVISTVEKKESEAKVITLPTQTNPQELAHVGTR